MQTEDGRKTFRVAFANGEWHWDTLVDEKLRALVHRILNGEFRTQTEAGEALGYSSKGTVSKLLKKAIDAGITTRADIDAALRAAQTEAANDEAHYGFR